jgi:hypothetical protein
MARRPRPTPARPDGRLGRRPPLEVGGRATAVPRHSIPANRARNRPLPACRFWIIARRRVKSGMVPPSSASARRSNKRLAVLSYGISAPYFGLGVLPNVFAAAKTLIAPDTTAFPRSLACAAFPWRHPIWPAGLLGDSRSMGPILGCYCSWALFAPHRRRRACSIKSWSSSRLTPSRFSRR